MDTSGVWECQCGHIEYCELPPEDCPECLRVGKFIQVPEDMIEEKEAESIVSRWEEEDD
jgi:hypothetical protein